MFELLFLSIAGFTFGIMTGIGFYFGGVIGDHINKWAKG